MRDAVVGVLLLGLTSGYAAAQTDQIPAEALAAWAKYRTAPVCWIQLEGRSFEGPGVQGEKLYIEYKAHNDLRLVIQEQTGKDTYRGEAWGHNERYRFHLLRPGPQRPWVLASVALPAEVERGYDVDYWLSPWNASLRYYSLNFLSYPLDQLVQARSFRAQQVERDPQKPQRWRITFTADPRERLVAQPAVPGKTVPGDLVEHARGYFVLDAEYDWLPVEGAVESPDTATRMVMMRSDFREQDGWWYPSREKLISQRLSTGQNYESFYTVSAIRVKPPPAAEEFRLTAFGLPEPEGTGSRWWWVVLVAGVAALLGLGIYLRRRA